MQYRYKARLEQVTNLHPHYENIILARADLALSRDEGFYVQKEHQSERCQRLVA